MSTSVFRSSYIALGARRAPLTSKQGNKNYYKGTRSGRMGRWTSKGQFVVESWRLRQYIVPEGLDKCKVKVS